MADILKISTPLVNKNQAVQPKAEINPTAAFDLQNISKVVQPHGQSELLKQNNGMIQGETPNILQNLLKDPAVTVTYLRNIFMLEEIIKLLPANNKTVTEEIEQMFQVLLVQPEEIASEMKKQENVATMFRGELFDLLRQVSAESPPGSEIQFSIANLLKALNHLIGNEDALDAVANSLRFLQNSLSSSRSLSDKLEELIQRYRAQDEGESFASLKKDTQALLKEVEESILYSPKLEKVVSITTYNLSRYNENVNYLKETQAALLHLLTGENRTKFRRLLTEFVQNMAETGPIRQEASKVMEILIKLISVQADEDNQSLPDSGKIEKIIHSLLSSPCNFTPLLHFVVPVLWNEVKSFAEIWINPNADEEQPGGESGIQLLLVIDIEGEGRFEAELFVKNRVIDFTLLCPLGSEEKYQRSIPKLSAAVAGLAYRFGSVRVERLDHPRSLMEVFKSLPYKRTGVDVKI